MSKKIIHITPSDFKFPRNNMTKADWDTHIKAHEFEEASYYTTKQWAEIIRKWKEKYSLNAQVWTEHGGQTEDLTLGTLEGDVWALDQWERRRV